MALMVVHGQAVPTANAGPASIDGRFAAGVARDETGIACCLNGGAVATAAGLPPLGLTALRVGQNAVMAGCANGEFGQLNYPPGACRRRPRRR